MKAEPSRMIPRKSIESLELWIVCSRLGSVAIIIERNVIIYTFHVVAIISANEPFGLYNCNLLKGLPNYNYIMHPIASQISKNV